MQQTDDRLNLNPFGHFRYDPFSDLDAARDQHLSDYLVVPPTPAIALKSSHSVIYAMPGGGKTALRLYTEQMQQDLSGITFTLTYLIREDRKLDQKADHQQKLLEALAYESLIRIVTYPTRFLALAKELQEQVAGLIDAHLAFNMDFALESALNSLTDPINRIADLDNRTYVLKSTFNNSEYRKEAFAALRSARDCAHRSRSSTDWQSMSLDNALLLTKEAFSAKEIYILLDGIDNSTEAKKDPGIAARWIMPLFERTPSWEKQDIYLKAFLTTELEEHMESELASLRVQIPTNRIEWNSDFLLINVIRARVAAATNNLFNSLYAISSLDLREIELELVHGLPPERRLPRELLLVVRYTLLNALKRNRAGKHAQVIRRDVNLAFEQYHALLNRADK